MLVRVVRLINDWLSNEHVTISDDILAEMGKFIDDVNNSNSPDEPVLEIMLGIHGNVCACVISLSH